MGIYGNISDLRRAVAFANSDARDFREESIEAHNKVCEVLDNHKEKMLELIAQKEALEKKVEKLEKEYEELKAIVLSMIKNKANDSWDDRGLL